MDKMSQQVIRIKGGRIGHQGNRRTQEHDILLHLLHKMDLQQSALDSWKETLVPKMERLWRNGETRVSVEPSRMKIPGQIIDELKTSFAEKNHNLVCTEYSRPEIPNSHTLLAIDSLTSGVMYSYMFELRPMRSGKVF